MVSLAIVVLFVSIYRTTLIKYDFSLPNDSAVGMVFTSELEYSLPYPGISPDHPFWFLKATRDRVWLFLTRDDLVRANRTLFIADKRLVMAKKLSDEGKFDLGIVTAVKAEQYLEDALKRGMYADVKGKNSDGFFETLAKASLTHREVLESIMLISPEDAKPVLNQLLDKPKLTYAKAAHELNKRQKKVPGIDF
ncbi:MAG: hypothetical protein HYU80_00130 [Candidatus Blackburnbacteria bacterium]|nr:hypothetical protein [Candidatus Blackburnbacteria bacterium]